MWSCCLSLSLSGKHYVLALNVSVCRCQSLCQPLFLFLPRSHFQQPRGVNRILSDVEADLRGRWGRGMMKWGWKNTSSNWVKTSESRKLIQAGEGLICADSHGGRITMYGNAQLLWSSLLSVSKWTSGCRTRIPQLCQLSKYSAVPAFNQLSWGKGRISRSCIL